MGTSYDPYCIDCDDVHGGMDDCRDVPALQALCRNAAQLAALAPLFEAMRKGYADPTMYMSYQRDRIDVAWFEKHATHRLTVRDEYGRCIDECGEYFGCTVCGHKSTRCRRPEKHDGPHSAERDTTDAQPKETP